MKALTKTIWSLASGMKLNLFFGFIFTTLALFKVTLSNEVAVDKVLSVFSLQIILAFYINSSSFAYQVKESLSQGCNFLLPNYRLNIGFSFAIFFLILCLIPSTIIYVFSNMSQTALLLLICFFSVSFLLNLFGKFLHLLITPIIFVAFGYEAGKGAIGYEIGTFIKNLTGYQPTNNVDIYYFYFLLAFNIFTLALIYAMLLKYNFSTLSKPTKRSHKEIVKNKEYRINNKVIKLVREKWLALKLMLVIRKPTPDLAKFSVAFWSNNLFGMTGLRIIVLIVSLTLFYQVDLSSFIQGFKDAFNPKVYKVELLEVFGFSFFLGLIVIYGYFDRAILGDIKFAKKFLWLRSIDTQKEFLLSILKLNALRTTLETISSFFGFLICVVCLDIYTESLVNTMLTFIIIKFITIFFYILSEIKGDHFLYSLLSNLASFACVILVMYFLHQNTQSEILVFSSLTLIALISIGILSKYLFNKRVAQDLLHS